MENKSEREREDFGSRAEFESRDEDVMHNGERKKGRTRASRKTTMMLL
jgi:hypothetical protein